MTNRRKPQWLLTLFSLLILSWLSVPLRGQTTSSQGTANVQSGDNDTQRLQVANVDEFLDAHPEIGQQLRRDPSLINNEDFLQSHPALQQYLQLHPGIREEVSENPRAFMQEQERFDNREGERRDFDPDNDLARWQVADMDSFLDHHPEIAEQLRKDPSLVHNNDFLKNHPGLQEFLQQHPGIREEFDENPQAFMRREERFDNREGEGRGFDRDNDLARWQIASMDNFLDHHPEIAEQLRKDPSLVRNNDFLKNHPGLQEFLQQHPGIREEFDENPQAFMHREERYDRWDNRADRRMGDADTTRAELTNFGQFLGNHSSLAQQLVHDPSLVNNKEYLESHSDLREYLKAHPQVKEELTENPQAFMNATQQQGSTTKSNAVVTKPKKGDQ